MLRESTDPRNQSYVVIWCHGQAPRYHWHIRGISPDRSFYGELLSRLGNGGKSVNLAGTLSPDDYSQLRSLIDDIEQSVNPDDVVNEPWVGMIAEGPPSDPRVIYKHLADVQHDSPNQEVFLKIIALLTPYLRDAYAAVV